VPGHTQYNITAELYRQVLQQENEMLTTYGEFVAYILDTTLSKIIVDDCDVNINRKEH
jgi:hypothetical protein